MFIARYSRQPDSEGACRTFADVARRFLGDAATVEFADPQIALAQKGGLSEAPYSNTNIVSVASGVAFRYGGRAVDKVDLSTQLCRYLTTDGPDFVGRLNGQFGCAIANRADGSLYVARDQLGIEPVYYGETPFQVVFSSSARAVAALIQDGGPTLDHAAIGRYFCFNYNPGKGTFWRGVSKFPAGHYALLENGQLRFVRYWYLSYANQFEDDEQTIVERLRAAMQSAILSRAEGVTRPGVFVSGGLDSSTVLGVLAEHSEEKIHTFSYRCRGRGFDESHYARLMAKSVASEHIEVEYGPESVDIMRDLVMQMDEPFCDVGINVATGLLGRAAAGVTDTVFTGDGGDELFGSHPIYEADKIARYTDRLPGFVVRPIASVLTLLPDSDKKKTLAVKLKRFGESLRFPRELRTHRWRLYYILEDLERLLQREVAESLSISSLFDDVVQTYEGADSDGLLERTLYSDYQTIVDFYLRRNDLNRHLGIETRYPLFDIELVELCARIPSNLKTAGWFDTKHIMKKAIEPWLPHEIVYREDKLGHSIPLKNWLREDSHVRQFVQELIDENRLGKRGIINPDFVAKQWGDHMSLKRNNSHRLWTIAVFELWLDAHIGSV